MSPHFFLDGFHLAHSRSKKTSRILFQRLDHFVRRAISLSTIRVDTQTWVPILKSDTIPLPPPPNSPWMHPLLMGSKVTTYHLSSQGGDTPVSLRNPSRSKQTSFLGCCRHCIIYIPKLCLASSGGECVAVFYRMKAVGAEIQWMAVWSQLCKTLGGSSTSDAQWIDTQMTNSLGFRLSLSSNGSLFGLISLSSEKTSRLMLLEEFTTNLEAAALTFIHLILFISIWYWCLFVFVDFQSLAFSVWETSI